MVIQLKKAIVIFIFLISIIGILLYQNYSLKGEFYNILLISNKDDLTEESLTKNVWDDLKELNSQEKLTSYYTTINSTYLEIDSTKDFEAKIKDQLPSNDMFVIMGDVYNESLTEVISHNLDKKFVLIENSQEYTYDNTYQINFKWESIDKNIESYLQSQIETLKSEKELVGDEKLKVVYFIEGTTKDSLLSTFENILSSVNIELYFIDITQKNYLSKIDSMYNEDNIQYYINLNFQSNKEIITELVKLQKENIFDYYKQENENTIQTSDEESDSSDIVNDIGATDDTKTVDMKYLPIHYISTYRGESSLGEYDDILTIPQYTTNILVNTFNYTFVDTFTNIIIEKGSLEIEISQEKENLEINQIQ